MTLQQTITKGEPYRETKTPLLRPVQVEEFKEEKARLEGELAAPPQMRSRIQDIGQVVKQLKNLDRQLEVFTPREYGRGEIDQARAREKYLRGKWSGDGMPTQAEMRRNPPGAVDKHRAWEERNKEIILEWKNIRLRLLQGGQLNTTSQARDAANIEMFRPVGGAQELNLDVAQITRPEMHFPPGVPASVVMTDEEITKVRELAPELADKLTMMAADFREKIKALIEPMMGMSGEEEVTPIDLELEKPKTAKKAVKSKED